VIGSTGCVISGEQAWEPGPDSIPARISAVMIKRLFIALIIYGPMMFTASGFTACWKNKD
jgi:hypothetical protein